MSPTLDPAAFSNAAPSIDIGILVEAGPWPAQDELEAVAGAALSAAVHWLGLSFDNPPELSLVFTDDAHIQVLNAGWRGFDKPTNVLSFPLSAVMPGDPPPPMLGDIVLAHGTVEREALEEGKPFAHHLSHLIVHGFLHLIGYDHEEEADALRMETAERQILALLAIPDPYR